MYFYVLLLFSLLPMGYGVDRKVTSDINPGCTGCSPNVTLLYVKAVGANDTIHQMWDFTNGIPTMIFLVGDSDLSAKIEWNEQKPVKFTLNTKPTYSFAAAINKIIEYKDVNDTGFIKKDDPRTAHLLDEVRWRRAHSLRTENEVMLHMVTDGWPLGTLELKLDLLPFEDYGSELPHLIHTANSTLADVALVNLTGSESHADGTRFAVHFLLASTDTENGSMHYVMRRSLDDEHTPGIFEIIEIKSPRAYQEGCGGYLQFNPVAYTQPERGVTASTLARASGFDWASLPRHSTIWRFFEELRRWDADRLTQDVTLSFGEAGDGFYRAHNYTSWSFTIGYGSPPDEKFSLFVVLVICVGLGVPVALAVSGVTYVLVRRRRQRSSRARLFDED